VTPPSPPPLDPECCSTGPPLAHSFPGQEALFLLFFAIPTASRCPSFFAGAGVALSPSSTLLRSENGLFVFSGLIGDKECRFFFSSEHDVR